MAWNDDLPTPVGPDGSPVYFDRTYRETMTLLVETRDYMRFREPADRGAMPDDHRLAVNCEALRVTSRLTHIMAWLLIQKAVHAGEMTAAEAAAADHRLAGQSVCRERVVAGGVAMPPMLEHLLERSYQLYARRAAAPVSLTRLARERARHALPARRAGEGRGPRGEAAWEG